MGRKSCSLYNWPVPGDNNSGMDFDSHTLGVLEFDAIRGMLADKTASALGREKALELTPTPIVAFVRDRQKETAEALTLLQDHGGIPFGGVRDVRTLFVKADIGQNLVPTELLDLAATITGGTRLKQFVTRHAEKAPLLADRVGAIEDFPVILRDVEQCIGRNAEVLDSASPALASTRSRLKVLENRVNERLNQFLSSATYRPMLMDGVVVLRDDRRCLPVRAEYKNQIRGIVHDQSSSGATLFIEPMAVVELNNEIREEELKERAEVERVLRKLTETVARFTTRLATTVEVIATVDLAAAKARLADEWDAVAPAINTRGIIRLRDARHPLIDREKVVPTSLEFGDKTTVLLITGPNTGGKTVTLKTVALFTVMMQAGLFVPAGPGTELAIFDQIFADIGDDQSITASLSTFSAHITNITRIFKTLGTNALVVMDEVGSGTDPAEGAALAKAILAYLMTHKARVIATTHYGELKEFAYTREGIDNVAVEFDIETLRPTYRILQGVPGASNALHIARRLGMPNAVIESATAYVGREDIEAGELMVRLEAARKVADNERRRAESTARELDNLKRKYEDRLRDLEVLRSEAKAKAAEEAKVVIRRNTEKMENIIGELRRLGKEGRKTNSARKKMREVAEEMVGGIGVEKEPVIVDEGDVPTGLRKGDKVRVLSLGGTIGDVLSDKNDEEAVVQVGMLRVTVPLTGLRREGSSPSGAATAVPPARPEKRDPTGLSRIGMTKAATINPEISLIAMRAESALSKLDKYIDDALAAGLDTIRIVHGKGTGQLRRAVWEMLKDDARVSSHALAVPEEGGAGVTIARLG